LVPKGLYSYLPLGRRIAGFKEGQAQFLPIKEEGGLEKITQNFRKLFFNRRVRKL